MMYVLPLWYRTAGASLTEPPWISQVVAAVEMMLVAPMAMGDVEGAMREIEASRHRNTSARGCCSKW